MKRTNLKPLKILDEEERSSISDVHFSFISKFIYDRAGINLIPNSKNKTLVGSRLQKVLRTRELDSVGSYIQMLKANSLNPDLVQELVNALTTNTTHFFREEKHFQYLKEWLPIYLKERESEFRKRNLRVWCSAASTGEEPYTILMTIMEALESLPFVNLKMLATDIDTQVLEVASQGVYESKAMEGVPAYFRRKYFEDENGDRSRVRETFRKKIQFRPFNLMKLPYTFDREMDVIFCRNVMIYFKREDNLRITEEFSRHLAPGGLLIIGHSETGLVSAKGLVGLSQGIYQRR